MDSSESLSRRLVKIDNLELSAEISRSRNMLVRVGRLFRTVHQFGDHNREQTEFTKRLRLHAVAGVADIADEAYAMQAKWYRP